jgi:hypothetical protein
MSKCTTTIPEVEFQNMLRALPILSEVFARKGKLTEADMDNERIMSINDQSNRKTPLDNRPMHQQRAILLTADDSIAKYRNYQKEREMAPIIAAAKTAERNRVRAEKKAANDAKKIESEAKAVARAAEKRRIESLTPDELKAEKAAKRRLNKERRLATAEIVEAVDRENQPPQNNIIDELASRDINLEIFDDVGDFI